MVISRNQIKKQMTGTKNKSKVNEAGNYTKPDMRKKLFISM